MEWPCDRFKTNRMDPLAPACEECGFVATAHVSGPKQRTATAEKSGNRDPKTGQFGEGNTAGTGGQSGWLKRTREALRDDVPTALATLRRVMASEDGKAATAAAKVVLEYSMPKPRQTHRVEGKNGDPLGFLSPEALVAFITGKKEGT